MSGREPGARDVAIRPITEGELDAWVAAMDASFLLPVPAGAVPFVRELSAPGRSVGAFAADQCVGTLRSLDLEVTVPGGDAVAAEGITNVAVVQAWRRRGLLTRMMRDALDAAVARGRCMAALIASEYRIYGRFGFGPATRAAACDIDVRRAGAVRVPGAGAGGQHVEPIGLAEAREHGPVLHERFRRTRPGAITRDRVAWRQRTGSLRSPYRHWHEPAALLCRDTGGTPTGMVLYHAEGSWQHGDPEFTLTVDDLLAVHPAAAAALWRHLLATEWVTRVTVPSLSVDDPLPLLLDNPRACVLRPGSGQDHLWLRILDVTRALEARRYDAPGTLVLEVTDRTGYAQGRYALEAGRDGHGSVTATAGRADLALDISTLATIYLGDHTAGRLAAAGLVTEQRTGAVERADRMLRTAARPWCPDGF
jgi:predicted acetyltransferase